MTVTSECTLTLPLVDFRRAVAAVKPHAERAKSADEITSFQRVRFIAAKTELLVAATNGTTAALAAVEILEDSRAERFAADDGSFAVDISPQLVTDLRDGLRMQRGDIVEDEQACEVVLTDTRITVRDVSGLWPDSETTRPLLAYSADYPDLRKILAGQMNTALQEVKPMTSPDGVLARFAAASRAYDRPLQFEPTGPASSRGFLVWCGEKFIGMVSSGHDDDDSLAKRQSYRRRHLERLGLAKTLEIL